MSKVLFSKPSYEEVNIDLKPRSGWNKLRDVLPLLYIVDVFPIWSEENEIKRVCLCEYGRCSRWNSMACREMVGQSAWVRKRI